MIGIINLTLLAILLHSVHFANNGITRNAEISKILAEAHSVVSVLIKLRVDIIRVFFYFYSVYTKNRSQNKINLNYSILL